MSIILKGIDLPNGPIKLVLYPSGKVDEYVFNERIATDYQATQIPTPHGRLKDIDKIKDELRDQIPAYGLDGTYRVSNAFDEMDNAPTILEAEE